MLVAVPVETKDMNAAVCPSFGRAPYFLLFNTLVHGGLPVHEKALQTGYQRFLMS